MTVLIRDHKIYSILKKTMSDDRKLSYEDVKLINQAANDDNGVTYKEFNDLKVIFEVAVEHNLFLDTRAYLLAKRYLGRWYHHLLHKKEKKRTYQVPYEVKHIPSETTHNRRPCTAMIPLYLTIHSTGNLNSTAQNERDNLARQGNTRVASFHLVVDETKAIECIPLNEVAYHAGDGAKGTGNSKTIGLEICESGDREKTLKNAISLTSKVLKSKGWDVSTLKQHNDWATKLCPRIFIVATSRKKPTQTWEWFKEEVRKSL